MNKIYKLIWSKVKNMWVVASELAKSHTKSPNSGIVGVASLASLESKMNMDLSKGFVAGVFPMVNRPIAKFSDFKITVAAIVKNEAENVPTWVQAARSCADEIVVVDTGSADGTVERFADYGIKCFHYEWNDDFSSAKNYMISLCHGDWIVLLDGDEWFREGCDVRKAIAKHHGNPITKAIIADWICLDKDRNNAVMFSGGAVRAFRNQPDVRYFRKVHENLTIGYENFAFEPDFKMYHTGYSGSVNRSKHERNLRIMRMMFDFDNGKVEYPTDWRYIEDTYAGLGDFDKALWAADKMIGYGVQDYSASAWVTKFNVLFCMKVDMERIDREFDYCFRTVPSVSGFRFLASIYYMRNGRPDIALEHFTEGVRILMGPQDRVAQEHTYWRMYLPEATALVASYYLQHGQSDAALVACSVCEQYCGKTTWVDPVFADVRRQFQVPELAKNHVKSSRLKIINRNLIVSVLSFLISCGAVMPVEAVTGNYSAGGGSATDNYGISIGNSAKSQSVRGISLGLKADSQTDDTIAIGSCSVAGHRYDQTRSGLYAIAIGTYAFSGGQWNIAMGMESFAGYTSSKSIAIGGSIGNNSSNTSSIDGAVALGYCSVANVSNVVSVGHAKNDTYVIGSCGTTSTYSSDYFRRIINVANGTGAHDAATYGQVSGAIKALSVSGKTITYTKIDGTTGTITTQDTNTTYSNMTAATASAAGKAGLVPAPAAGKQTAFLRGDGTWVVPTNTTYSAATSSALGLVKTGANITNSSGTISLTKANVTAALGYTPLSLSGGTMTGRIAMAGKSSAYNKGRDNALIATSSISAYSPLASIKTKNGSWEIGAYDSSGVQDRALFTYITDTDYNGTNKATAQFGFGADGVLYTPKGVSGLTKAQITTALGYTPPTADTNTHYTTHLYAGSGTAANAATTNGNTKIALADDSTVRNTLTIKGAGKTTVTSDAAGVITITSTDANTTYGNTSAAELKTGTATAQRAMTAAVISPYLLRNVSSSSYSGDGTAGTSDGWGTINKKSYTNVLAMSTSTGGGIVFADKNQQTSMQIDGKFYQNEGQYEVLDTSSTLNASKLSGLTKAQVTTALGYTPPTADTNTHYTTHLYAGSGTAANAATTNGNTKIALVDDSTVRNTLTINGTGATTVTSDANGVITINSTDNNTTYSAGTGLSLSGTTFSVNTNGSVASGNVGVLNGGIVYSEVRPTADGTFVQKANTTAANITALDTAAKNAIKELSVSGQTITYTKGDGTTGTITTQDTDTIYDTMTASELTAGTSTDARTISAKVLVDYVNDRIGSSTVAIGSIGSTAMGDGSEVTGNNSVGIGDASKVTGNASVSVGTGSAVEGNDGVSVGNCSTVTGDNSVGIGSGTTIGGANAVGIGKGSEVSSDNGVALGNGASSTETGAISIGSGSSASGAGSTSLGFNAESTGTHSVALGDGATSSAAGSVALGSNSVAGAADVISLGHKATDTDSEGNAYGSDLTRRIVNLANGTSATDAATVGQTYVLQNGSNTSVTENGTNSIGQKIYQMTVNTDGQVASGNSGIVTGGTVYDALESRIGQITVGNDAQNTVALGDNSSVSGDGAVAVGSGSSGSGVGSVAIGDTSASSGESSVAVGSNSKAESDNTVVIGTGSAVTGTDSDNSVAIGKQTSITGSDSVALGADSLVIGNNSSALGGNTVVHNDNSVALGSGSNASNDNVVSVGHKATDLDSEGNAYGSDLTRRIVNVADGVDAHDVVTVGQMNQQIAGLNSSNTALDNRIGTVASDGNYIRSSTVNDVAANLLALDTQLKNVSDSVGHVPNFSINSVENTALASGTDAIAIGNGTVASGNQSISIGTGNRVTGSNSGAIGDPNIVDGSDSYVVGNNSTVRANVRNAFVLGNNTTVDNGLPANWDSMSDEEKATWANELASTDIMEGAVTLGSNISVSLNNKAVTSRTFSGDPAIKHVVALGDNVVIGEENAVGIGHTATATALNALAIGDDAQAVAEGANAVGHSSRATNRFANASGYQAQATGEGAGAFGQDAQATANFATAFGRSTRASAESATAIGNTAHAVTQSSIAIGSSAVANGGSNTNAVAIGRGAAVGSDTQGYGETLAIGSGTNVQNTFGSALGSSASVTGQKGTAIGYNSSVTATNAIALGADSVADTADTVSVGATGATRKIVNVMNGSADTDVSTVGQTGNDLDLSGSTLSLKNANGTVLDSVTLPEAPVYTAGDGLQLTGTEFKAKAGDHVSVTDNGINVLVDGAVDENNTGLVSGGDVYTAVNTEKTARETAITGEATARSDADTALQNNIDTLSNVAVKYDSVDTKDKVTLAGTDGTAIDNVKDATLSATSKEAVTGSQLFATNTNIATEITNRTNADTELGARIGTVSADGNYIKASSTYNVAQNLSALDTAVKANADAIAINTGDITNLKNLSNITEAGETVVKNLAKGSVNVVGSDKATVAKTDIDGVDTYSVSVRADGQVAQGNENLVSGGTVYDALSTTKYEIATDLASKANVALDNVTDAGHAVIKTDAKSAVNVVGGTYAIVDKTDVNGVDTYTVNVATDGVVADGNAKLVTGGTVYNALQSQNTEIQTALDGKSNVGLNNITDDGKAVVRALAQESVKVVNGSNTMVTEGTDGTYKIYAVTAKTDGSVADGDTGIVTGGAVYDAIQDAVSDLGTSTSTNLDSKANTSLNNVTDAGHSVIKTDAKSALHVTGSGYVMVTKTDVDGVDTYAVNVAANGLVADGNTGLVTGDTVYDEVRPASDGNYIAAANTTGANLSALDTQVKANADAISNNKTHFFGVNSTNEYDMNYDGGGAVGTNAVAIGTGAWANTDNSIAIGPTSATMFGEKAIAVGYLSAALAENAVAVGSSAQSPNAFATAVGSKAIASGWSSTAIGKNAYASGKNSIAVGSDSTALGEDEFSVGRPAVEANAETGQTAQPEVKRRITHVDTGVNDTDAVNVKQLNDALYDKADWNAANIGRNLVLVDDEYPDGMTAEQKAEHLAEVRQHNLQTWGEALGAGTVTGGDSRLVTGDTVHVEVRPAENGTYVKTNNTTGQNLLALDQQLSTVLEGNATQNTAISGLQNEMETKANVGLDNITDAGKTVVRDLAKESVKVVNGTNTTVTEGMDGNAKTYAVNAVTDGAVADGNTGIVTGGTVYSAIQDMIASSDTIGGKANVALDNVTEAGHTVIKTDAKSAVNVTGNSDVTVTKTDVDGVDTYNVAVVKTGTVTDGNEGIVTGGTVYDALTAETRPAADGNYIAADHTAGANLTALDTQVKTNADAIAVNTTDITNLKDLSNITDAGQTVVKNLAKGSVNVVGANKATVTKTNVDGVDTYTVDVKADGVILADNKGLVDGGTVFDAVVAATGNIIDYTNDGLAGKANVELDNINPAGHTVIKTDAKSAINVAGGTNAEVVKTDVDGVDTYTVNVAGNGQVAENNTGLINGGAAYSELRPTDGNYVRKDATTAANLSALDTKIGTVANGDFVQASNTVGQNLNALDEALYDKANWDGSNIGRNTVVTEDDYPAGLTDEQKAEYAANLREYNLQSWGQALGAGTVKGGDSRLITGDTLHVEVRPANSGTYVKVDKTTGENLLALDEQLSSVASGAAAQSTTITTLENEMTNKANIALDNINADGQNVVRNIAKSAVVVADGPNTTVASSTDTDGNITYRVTANATGSVTDGNTGLVDGGAVYTAIENAKAAMGRDIGGLDADGNYIRKANTVVENLVALDTQVKTNADGLAAEQTARETADTALGNRIGTLTADGNYIAKGSPVSENLSGLDTAVKSVSNKADSNSTEITNLKDLSNITAAGETVIKNLVKGSVKVINGTRTTVTEGADGDIKTFAVNVDANGMVTNGNTGLVTGGTVKSALDALSGSLDTDLAGKANVSLDNVSGAGHAVIKSDAKSAINVVGGQYATVAKTDVNGVDTYTVNVATDGSVADGNRKLVTGGTVYNALRDVRGSVNTSLAGKANTSLDNLDVDGMGRVRDIAKSAVSIVNGTNTTAASETGANGNVVYKVNVSASGSVASGNAGIMSGGMMYNELRPADGNYVARSNTTAANLTALDAAVKEAMMKADTAQAVTGGNVVVYDTDDRSSVTLGGTDGTAIHNVADGAVTAGSKDAVTGGQLYTVKSAVDANTTAIAGLDTRIQDNTTAIAGLDTRVQDNTTAIDTLRTTVTNGLDGKTDTDLGNLTDIGKDAVRGLAKESVRVADGVNTTVRATVDGDASVYHVDVAANGRVESGNTGIVTGDAVYEAIRDIEVNASDTHYVSINPSEKDDETFANHGASGADAVAVGAKSYARGDESVAIGHNNDVSGNETYVIGSDVDATGNNSVVLGKGSDGSLDNVVSVGSAGNERRIVHVADGELSADSKDAVNGKQLYEVRKKLQNAEGIDVDKWSDALGTGSVAPDDERLVKGSTVYSAIQSTGISLSPDGSTMNVGAANNAAVVDFTNSEGQGRVLQGIVTDPDNPNSAANVEYVDAVGQSIINGVNGGLNRLDDKIDKVGAGAAALASLEPMPFDDDQKWSISAAVGTYHGTQAGAVGVFYKPQDNVMLNLRGAFGNGENMGGAGVSIGLNKGAAKGISKASMAKAMNAQATEIIAQKQLIESQQAQLDAQKAEIEELKQMVRSVVVSKQVDK